MSRVLVTGATGFVGSALVRFLNDQGCEVVTATRLESPQFVNNFVVGEITKETQWAEALSGVDAIVHLAGRAHVMDESSSNPLESYRRVNVEGTSSLARAAIRCGVSRMVFVSSIKVNGEETRDAPFHADDAANPIDPYGVSKYEAELGLLDLASDLQVAIVRPPLIYGPGVKANFLRMMRIVQRGVPLPLARVHNRRSMISLTNLCDVLHRCVLEPGAAGQVFLVSDDDDVSTTQLLRLLALSMKVPSRLVPVPLSWLKLAARIVGKTQEIERLCGSLQVDVLKTKQLLKWRPVLTVEQGIAQTTQWFLKDNA